MSTSPRPDRWTTLALGAEPRLRRRAGQSLLAWAIYLAFAMLQYAATRLGLVDADTAWLLTLFNLSGATAFYLLARAGVLHERLGNDRAVMLQMVFAMVCTSLAYTAAGPVRAVPLVLVALVIPFGSFALSARQLRAMAWLGFGLMATAMAWRAATQPERYDMRVEALHAAAACGALLAVAAVAASLGRMRTALQAQRAALTQALAQIQALASRDELTGLANRRAALATLEAMLADAGRSPKTGRGAGLSLVLIDLDHFKQINDGWGHAVGDAALQLFAQIARQRMGPDALVARWGGEEFLLALGGVSPDDAVQATQQLANALRGARVAQLAPGLRLSFSAGVAHCRDATDLPAAIDRADRAMYQAKRSGRDRVLMAVAPAGPMPPPAPGLDWRSPTSGALEATTHVS